MAKSKNEKQALLADTQIRRQLLARALLNNSILTSRARYGNTTTFDGLRDVWDTLGYPGDGAITFSDYYLKFKRQDIARRIVSAPVDGAWRLNPVVVSDTDAFTSAWEEIEERLGLCGIMQRADIMAGIGQYGVILLGFDDQGELKDELTRAKSLLYAQPYLQDNAAIDKIVENQNDPRLNLPLSYGLQMNASSSDQGKSISATCHYSRVIHIADNLLESNIYGLPRLEVVYNRLLNMELIVGGSAEMFWQGAFPGMAFNIDPEYELDTATASTLTDEIENYVHNLERYMKLKGVDVESLSSSVADPKGHVDVQLKMISIATGIPKRILEGSERGELASSQDSESWNAKCDQRRRVFCEPVIIRPVIDRMIMAGVLPDTDYTIEWPDLEGPSDKDKADTGKVRADAISSYASSPDARMIVPPRSFLEEIMELPPEKVERIIDELKLYIGDALRTEQEGEDEEQQMDEET